MNLGRFFLSLPRLSGVAILLLVSTQLSSCAANSNTKSARPFNPDPYEKYNRKVFQLNMDLNKAILTPVVNAYDTVLPTPVRNGVRNVSGNIMMVPTIGNDALQANFKFMWRDTFRFALNSTMGCFGLVDVASNIGFGPRTQSFGLTLAKWGMRESPYVMVPLLGPSTVRGTLGFIPDYFMSPVSYITPTWSYIAVHGVQLLQNASDVLPQEETLMQMSLDPYVAVRSAYLQNRAYLQRQVLEEQEPDNSPGNSMDGSMDGSMDSSMGGNSFDNTDPLSMESSLNATDLPAAGSSTPSLNLRKAQDNLANG